MEREGISNCWMTKVRINRPLTNTDAMPAMLSGKVSLSFSSTTVFLASVGALLNGFSSFMILFPSTHRVKHAPPAGLAEKMHKGVSQGSGAVDKRRLRDRILWRIE